MNICLVCPGIYLVPTVLQTFTTGQADRLQLTCFLLLNYSSCLEGHIEGDLEAVAGFNKKLSLSDRDVLPEENGS